MKKSLRSILNGLGVAIVVVNDDRSLDFLNASAKSLFSKAKRGDPLTAIITRKKGLIALSQALDEGGHQTLRITLQDVVPTSYRITVAPIEAEKGPPQTILSFEDVSHIRDAERMREDFVANVSHELRSPLTALYGFIETLQGPARGDAAATQRFLGLMQEESERMARLIDDLLSLSKLQAIERDAPMEEADLKDVIDRVVETLAGVSRKEEIEIRVALDKTMPKVRGAPDDLIQVFQNLIENAVKYGNRGSVVTIRKCENDAESNHLCVSISDQGEGIDPKHIPRLTERFYRIDKGRSRAKGGTGLGLAIVKHILIRHRGWLDIKSVAGEGSTFSVYLPISDGTSSVAGP